MREILFRGKREDTGEWVYGSLVYWPGDNEIGTIVVFEEDEADLVMGEHIEVDLNTVGQYAGLKDKNGKKIFEGDIVRDYFGNVKTVRFMNGRYIPFNVYPEYTCWKENACEIIGNIHDNPELVEAKK